MDNVLRASMKFRQLVLLLIISGCQLTNPYLGKDVSDLISALDEPNAQNRVLAAEALQAQGPGAADAIPALVEGLFDPEPDVRVAARDALVAIGPEAVEPLFLALERSSEYGTSGDIGENIGEGILLFDVDAIPELTRLFHKYETGSPQRFGVVSALNSMINREGEDALAAGPVLVFAQGDPWTPTQVMASKALTRLGDSAVPDLIIGLSDPETNVRYYSAVVLGRIGPDAVEAGPALILVLDDPSPDVRSAAVNALEEIRFPFEYSPSDAQRIDDLIVALNNSNAEIRAATADALGQMGAEAESALPALEFAQEHDPDPAVREAAETAIQKIRVALNNG